MRSEQAAAKFKEIFEGVDLPEIKDIDFSTMSHAEMASLLPACGGKHPMKAILIDMKTGKAYGLASGWEAETVTHGAIEFKAGALSPEAASEAGGGWTALGNHVEAVATAFMRKMDIIDARLYINGANPCWGNARNPGCYYRMKEFLAEGSTMKVYNKHGLDFVASWPDRKFDFTGDPD